MGNQEKFSRIRAAIIIALMILLFLFLIEAVVSASRVWEVSRAAEKNTSAKIYAREYSENAFSGYMKNCSEANYSIVQTAYGYVIEEVPVYMVAFSYKMDDHHGTYGYRLTIDDNQQCEVLQEGTDVGKLIIAEHTIQE